MTELKLINEREITVKEGWGVHILPIFSGEHDDSHVVHIDVEVVEIVKDKLIKVGGVWCVRTSSNLFVPVENFKDVPHLTADDTHDLRTRWFASEVEADYHRAYTLRRWKNPQIWESYVCLE